VILPANIEEYLNGLAARYDEPVLLEMEEHAARNGFPIVGRLCGITLELVARMIGARRIFELGSGFGYSAYWYARALGDEGELHLTDSDPENERAARGYLERAGVWDIVNYHVGDALASFRSVEGNFDIVYCDAYKEGYPELWRAGRGRVRVGGLWICDNTLWSGRIVEPDPDARDERTRAILEHNELVSQDPDYVTTIVPLRDGLMVALRLR
jgi:predicted O-methyltransferase YrrM